MVTAAIASSLLLAVRPSSWRRPVRDEFWRFAHLAGPGSLKAVIIAGALVGVGLVGQGIFWLDAVGRRDVVERTLLILLIRDVTPITVGLVALGRAGLINLSELSAMRASGTIRTLEARGLDTIVLLVMPRVLALGLCTFVQAVVFVTVCVVVGHLAASALGVAGGDIVRAMRVALRNLGEAGIFVLPLKTILMGFAIAAATSVTALRVDARRPDSDIMPAGFFRALLAVFLVSVLGSVAL